MLTIIIAKQTQGGRKQSNAHNVHCLCSVPAWKYHEKTGCPILSGWLWPVFNPPRSII